MRHLMNGGVDKMYYHSKLSFLMILVSSIVPKKNSEDSLKQIILQL